MGGEAVGRDEEQEVKSELVKKRKGSAIGCKVCKVRMNKNDGGRLFCINFIIFIYFNLLPI